MTTSETDKFSTQPGRKLWVGHSTTRKLRSFGRDDSGHVAIIFGLTTFIICALVGGAVDFGRWVSARNQTQAAIDSALLAAGRTAQTTYGDKTASINAANAYYKQMKSPNVVDDTITFTANSTATTFSASGSANIVTPFLQFACPSFMYGCQDNPLRSLPVINLADARGSQATIAQGGNSGTNIEISMMLDTTGSMAGQKLTDMQAAAKDLIDIVVWNDQGEYTSRIALAPFSEVVNAGSYFQAITNQNPVPASHYVYPTTCYNSTGTVKNSCLNKSQYLVVDNIAKSLCVTERMGDEAFTDRKPGSDAWVTSFNDARASAYSNRTALLSAGAQNGTDFDSLSDTTTTTCLERSPIMPLTSDKTALKNAVDSFVAENSTAGALGTAWAWYLLSPEWKNIWPKASEPMDYSKISELGPSGQPRLQKIALLMTDGAYNTARGVQFGDNSTPAATIRDNAVTLCTNMKAKGIKVYTVGFQIDNNNALTMLQNCATDGTHYYNAANGDALKAAFRDIALKISKLRISH